MPNLSVTLNSPIEIVETTPLNPLISKCQVKVCYVGEEPNRNGSVITKEVARNMANSLPGSPIVGFYDEEMKDFDGHNQELVIDDDSGEFLFKSTTRPYGFVDLNAKVWFEKFLDDGIEHEYLMTEGYLWTGQYEEAKRIIERGNNQSMELDVERTTGNWSKSDKGNAEFFIINEAVISKLCILGESVEPCFEGASITSMNFSFDEGFKTQFFALMREMKEILEKGDTSMTKLNEASEAEVIDNIVDNEELNNEDPAIEIVEEEIVEETVVEDADEESVVETVEENIEPEVEDGEVLEDSAQVEDKTVEYNLEDVQEYTELLTQFSVLESEKATLETELNSIKAILAQNEAEVGALREFKLGVERKEKEAMIASFYMLSDEDKADVIANIDSLSTDDIEKELSVLCVRNKVSFNLEDNTKPPVTTFNLNNNVDDSTPAWIKAVQSVAKQMQ